MKALLSLIFLFLFVQKIYSQQQNLDCFVLQNNSNITQQRTTSTPPNLGPYCINIKFHIVRQSNGTGGFNSQDITQTMNQIKNYLEPVNIYPETVGYDFIDNTDLYNAEYYDLPCPPAYIYGIPDFGELIQLSNDPNALNIYIVNKIDVYLNCNQLIGELSGASGGIGSINLIMGKSHVQSNKLVHEIGHCLNLYHTHHGTFTEFPGDENQCPEFPDGSNSISCGDYIYDTPADPRLFSTNTLSYTANFDESTCTYYGGEGYNPDVSNIMSYGRSCRNHFSEGQGQRMRDALLFDIDLQNIVNNSCSISQIESEDEFTACFNNNNTTIISVTNGQPPYNWSSTSNIEIVQENGNSVIIKANNTSSGIGEVTCTFGSPSQTITKEIWLNNPLDLQSLSGPDLVSNNSVVNYIATPTSYQNTGEDGAQKYIWWLPHPFDIVLSGEYPNYNNPHWWYYEQYGHQIQATTGTEGINGYVQVWGANKCGTSGAKIMWVEHGTGGSGTPRIIAYPNEADSVLNVDLNNMPNGTLYVYLYDSYYNIVYYGEQTNDTIRTINTLDLNEGIYFLHVYDGVTLEIKQIIVNH